MIGISARPCRIFYQAPDVLTGTARAVQPVMAANGPPFMPLYASTPQGVDGRPVGRHDVEWPMLIVQD
jgi:hypothetical protein